jgi:SAM-dependent methyltransferase
VETGRTALGGWLEALDRRHRADLTFAEVRRAVQALSAAYVERRDSLERGGLLRTPGRRAAYALFYGPLHFLLVRHIVRSLGAALPPPRTILDLGCGTGAAGAAWAMEAGCRPLVIGVDRDAWSLGEARRTWADLGVRGRTRRSRIGDLPARPVDAIVAAFTVNELDDASRGRLLDRLLRGASRSARVLVVEPIARRSLPWWREWSEAFRACGGRPDEWRLAADLPDRLRLLDRAAGLDHREITGRSLWLGGRRGASDSRRVRS